METDPAARPTPPGSAAPTELSADQARLLPPHSTVGAHGELAVGGCSLPEVASRFGTPVYVFDEAGMRETMRRYRGGLQARRPRSRVCFASKSLPCLAAYAIAQEEGLSVDVAGEGELRLALAAGVDPDRIVLHGNAKSADEVALAVDCGVGLIVVDNRDDIGLIERAGATAQDVLIRVIPEIDAHTHPSIATGGANSKFGLPIPDARELAERLADHPAIAVRGFHLHIGSQILETEPFERAVEMFGALGGYAVYNVGGGLGVDYHADDHAPSVEEYLDAVTSVAARAIPPEAELILEPGRSLVARNGVTLYRVRNVKRTGQTFVAVDGGLADQMVVALTDNRYTAVVADRPTAEPDTVAQLVGRQCESGDLMVDRAELNAPSAGDTIALAATGAYSYTLVNNYNGALHPPVVFCRDGRARLVVRRQNYEELIAPHLPALQEAP